MATVRNSSDLAQKIMGVRVGVEYHGVQDAAKIIRQWANLQNDATVDLAGGRLARQLAKCILANIRRKDRFTPVAGGRRGSIGGLW